MKIVVRIGKPINKFVYDKLNANKVGREQISLYIYLNANGGATDVNPHPYQMAFISGYTKYKRTQSLMFKHDSHLAFTNQYLLR